MSWQAGMRWVCNSSWAFDLKIHQHTARKKCAWQKMPQHVSKVQSLTSKHTQMYGLFDACTCRWQLSVWNTGWIPATVDANPSSSCPTNDGRYHAHLHIFSRKTYTCTQVSKSTLTSIILKQKQVKEPGLSPELQLTWATWGRRPWLQLSLWLGSRERVGWKKFQEPLLQPQMSP